MSLAKPTTTGSQANLNKLLDAKLLEIPGIREAVQAATAAEEAQAAAARKAVLDELAETESTMGTLAEIVRGADADIVELRGKLDEMIQARDRREHQRQAAGAHAYVLARRLSTEHGNGLLMGAMRTLGAHAQSLYTEAARLRQLTKPALDWMGHGIRRPDEDALARADVAQKRAEHIDALVRDLDHLTRAPIAPQEIRRRVEASAADVGLRPQEVPAQGWQDVRWAPGAIPRSVTVAAPSNS